MRFNFSKMWESFNLCKFCFCLQAQYCMVSEVQAIKDDLGHDFYQSVGAFVNTFVSCRRSVFVFRLKLRYKYFIWWHLQPQLSCWNVFLYCYREIGPWTFHGKLFVNLLSNLPGLAWTWRHDGRTHRISIRQYQLCFPGLSLPLPYGISRVF